MASVAIFVRMEVVHRSCARFLSEASWREAFVALTLIVAWTGHSYLFPGVLLGGDTASHISRFLTIQRGLEAGSLPFWTNYQYMGQPLLWFTGPLTYVLCGSLSFLLHDPTAAAKVFLFSCHILAGWLFFAFIRRLGARPVAAMTSAALFSGCFANLHLFLYRGVFPQALTIVFLVALFHAADGLLRGKGRLASNAVVFALATAGLIVNHQPHALFACAYLSLFGAVAVATGFWSLGRLPVLAVSGILGVVASAVAILPTIPEADWVMIEPDSAPFNFRAPSAARLLNLVLWRNTRTTWGIDYWAYIGIGLTACALAGLVLLVSGRLGREAKGAALASACCLALCFFLYNPVVRDIMFLVFFAAVLAAPVIDWALPRMRDRSRLAALGALIVFGDLASTAILPVARTDKGFLLQGGQRMEASSSDRRMIQIEIARDGTPNADTGPDNTAMSYAALVQRLAGDHNMAATRVHNFAMALIKAMEADLRSGSAIGPTTSRLLAVFNVGVVVCTTPVANGCPDRFAGSVRDPVLGATLPVAQASPVLFSQALIRSAGSPSLEKPMIWTDEGDYTKPRTDRIWQAWQVLVDWLAVEAPDLGTRSARVLAVKDLPEGFAAPPPDQAWHPVLQAYTVGVDDMILTVSSDRPGFAQIAHPWFPTTIVTVNGQAVRPLRGATDFVVVGIDHGESVIRLRSGFSVVEKASGIVSMTGLLCIAAYGGLLARVTRRARAERG